MAHTIVIFGASGDLTRRKLIPALYELHRKKRLPPETTIVGMSRTQYSHDQWREVLREATAAQVGPKLLPDLWDEFARRIYYYPGDVSRAEDFPGLNAFISSLEAEKNTTRVYYLSLAPEFYECTVEHLGQAGMADETHAPRRIVVEKPFGRDLQSARALNAKIHEVFAEHQIYRIDH
ncbi:MAG: glucose-6-phosphate dehydrogenase, partial [Thermogutta sp.]